MVWTDNNTRRHRLWRDTDRGIVAGVCAGIADYIGVEPIVVRLVAVLCLVFFFPPTIVAYVVLTLVLRRRPAALYASPDEETLWRGIATAPADTLQSLKNSPTSRCGSAILKARLSLAISDCTAVSAISAADGEVKCR